MTDWRRPRQDKRRRWIARFTQQQAHLGEWVELRCGVFERSRRNYLAANEMLPFDKQRELDALREFRNAVGSGAFGTIMSLTPMERFRFLNSADAEQIGRGTQTRPPMSLEHFSQIVPDLWVKRSDLAKLFKSQEWRTPNWLEVSPLDKQEFPASPSNQDDGMVSFSTDQVAVYQNWIEQHKNKKPPSRGADLTYMRQHFQIITEDRVRELRRTSAPPEWTRKGRPKGSKSFVKQRPVKN